MKPANIPEWNAPLQAVIQLRGQFDARTLIRAHKRERTQETRSRLLELINKHTHTLLHIHMRTHTREIVPPQTVFRLTGLIPIETAGRKLDDDSWDRRPPVVDGMEDVTVVNAVQL